MAYNENRHDDSSKFKIIWNLLLIIILGVAFGKMYLGYKESRRPQPSPVVVWQDLKNDWKHSLDEYSGRKVIVLHFWASWCGICKQEFPGMIDALKDMGDHVTLITIAGDGNGPEVQKFASEMRDRSNSNIQFGYDPNGKALDAFGINAFPTTIILDPQLMVHRKNIGSLDWGDSSFKEFLMELHTKSQTPEAR